MKKLLCAIFALMLCFSLLAACQQQEENTIPGSLQTAGNVTVFVPEGWSLSASEDDPNTVKVYPDPANAGVYVKLVLHPDTSAPLPSEQTCQNVTALEAAVYGSFTWKGFSGNKTTGAGECSVIYLATQAQGHNFLATLWSDAGNQAFSMEDAQLQALLAGVSTDLVIPEPETLPSTEEAPATGEDVPPTESQEGPSAQQETTESEATTENPAFSGEYTGDAN